MDDAEHRPGGLVVKTLDFPAVGKNNLLDDRQP